jgi:hypothetical protein
MCKLTLPSWIGNFDSQNAIGKAKRARAIGDGTATSHRPGEQRTFRYWSASNGSSNDRFKACRSTVQGIGRPESQGEQKKRL